MLAARGLRALLLRNPRPQGRHLAPLRAASHPPCQRGLPPCPSSGGWGARALASRAAAFLDGVVNYEKVGVPQGAGTDGAEGFELGRMHRLLGALGDPHKEWPVIHVAGTKGKGSTVAFIASILRAAGYRVGTYTSPHVASLCERISTGGRGAGPIAPGALDALVECNLAALERAQGVEGGRISHFEIMTALAFRRFADEQVDVAVVEAGLGGVRDATNVFPRERLQLAVLTSIGREHATALGGTLESIAAAKAGIIKPSRPVVVGRQPEAAAAAVVRAAAAAAGAVLVDAHAQVVEKP